MGDDSVAALEGLQRFIAAHGLVLNHLNHELNLYSRANFKLNLAAALIQQRGLSAELGTATLPFGNCCKFVW